MVRIKLEDLGTMAGFEALQKHGGGKKKRASGPKEDIIQGQIDAYLAIKGIQSLRIPDLVYRLCSRFSILPAHERKILADAFRGFPDRVCFRSDNTLKNQNRIDNSCLMLETKRKNGVVSQGQRNWHLGLVVHVPETFEEARKLIDAWDQ